MFNIDIHKQIGLFFSCQSYQLAVNFNNEFSMYEVNSTKYKQNRQQQHDRWKNSSASTINNFDVSLFLEHERRHIIIKLRCGPVGRVRHEHTAVPIYVFISVIEDAETMRTKKRIEHDPSMFN